MKFEYAPEAVSNIHEIADYLIDKNPSAISRIYSDIQKALEILSPFPLAGTRQDVAEVRRIVTRKYRYLLYYKYALSDDTIYILAILSSRQNRKFEITQ